MSGRTVRYPVLLANVQAIMTLRHWDQSDLAHEIGVSQGTVSRWGTLSVPQGAALVKLAAIGGVSPTDFLEIPLQKAKPRPLTAPSGEKLTEAMAALLDSAGLPHLVDDYAERLAQLLPTVLEEMQSPVAPPETDEGTRDAAPPPDRAKPRRGKPL